MYRFIYVYIYGGCQYMYTMAHIDLRSAPPQTNLILVWDGPPQLRSCNFGCSKGAWTGLL